MESIMAYWPYWALYLVFAFAGWWCWNQLFFFLGKAPALQRLIKILGAVLLFTPAPIAHSSGHFAPAVFVVLLGAMSGEDVLHGAVITWFGAGLMAGLFAFLLLTLLLPAANVQKKTKTKAQKRARAAAKEA